MSLRLRITRSALTLAGFAALTAILTAPLAWRAGRTGPVNTGDGQWSIWCVAWVAHTITTDPLHLYDANIFAPHAGTLAYSEPNVVAGLLAAPAWLATSSPYIAYNSAVFLAFLLSALAAFALARRSTSGTGPAVISAIAFAFAPFVVVRLAHVQLLMTFGLPLSLLAFHRFVERQSAGRVAVLAVALAVTGLSSGYYGLAAGLAVGIGLVYYGIVRRLWRRPRFLVATAASVALAGLLVLPFFLPYLGLERGGSSFRTLEESERYSAGWRAYLTSTSRAHRLLPGALLPPDPDAVPERVLFPGFLTTLLGGTAVVLTWRRRSLVPSEGPANRETVGFYFLIALVAAWLSFGPDAGLYRLFYELAPGFSMLRAPARFGALVALALALLAGIAVSQIAGLRRSPMVTPALCLLLVGELAAVPFDLRPALPVPTPYRVLAGLPAGAVVEFPYFFIGEDLHRNALYMLYSTTHWRPMVNGYSDFIPDDYLRTKRTISTFPSQEAFQLLRQRGARYAVFHLQLYDYRSRGKLLERLDRYRPYLRQLVQAEDVLLYEITDWPQ